MKIWILFFSTLVLLLSGLFYVLLMLPPEAEQGLVQKIFFFHVPSAFSMYVSLIIGAIFSGIYLFDRQIKYDLFARASMWVATMFGTLLMVSGPVWAKPIWGVYWTWEPRLTTSFVIYILLWGYLFVRHLFDQKDPLSGRGATIGAIVAILAVLDIPLIHYSVKLWRGIHPSVIGNREGLPDSYRLGFEIMVIGFFLLMALMIQSVYRYLKISHEWNERKLNAKKGN